MANALRENVSAKSKEEGQQSASSRNGLIRRLMRGRDARVRFVDSHLRKGIAFQTQALRDKQGLSQQQLAGELGTNQNAVYRLENPNYGKQTLTTLKKVAAAFDVALIVRFVPFSQLLDWLTETPHLDLGLNPAALAVLSFDDEVRLGQFDECWDPTQSDTPPKVSSRDEVLGMADYVAGKAKYPLLETQKGGAIPISGGVEQRGGDAVYAEIGSPTG